MEELGIKKNKIKIIGQLNTVVTRMGVIIEVYMGILKIIDLNELNPEKNETEKVFLLPLEYFIDNKPEEYSVRLEVQPSFIDNDGNEIILFPSKELDIPDKYKKPWTGKDERIFVYKTEEGIIWGITAEIIYGFVKLLK